MSGHDCAVLGQSLLVVAKLVSNGEPLTGSILGPCERPYTARLEIPGMVVLRECRRRDELAPRAARGSRPQPTPELHAALAACGRPMPTAEARLG